MMKDNDIHGQLNSWKLKLLIFIHTFQAVIFYISVAFTFGFAAE
jgi:hypothetical protein